MGPKWSQLVASQKKLMIEENRDTNKGSGHKRKLIGREAATVGDYLGVEKDIPFLTELMLRPQPPNRSLCLSLHIINYTPPLC
jgi:hypothetical protein